MKVNTPQFRVSFPNVFAPQKNQFNGKEEYTLVALFPKGADLTVLKKAAQAAIIAKWPDESKRPKEIRTPFRDQAEKAKTVDGKQVLRDGYEEGAIFMNLKSNKRPSVVDQNVQAILDESEFYPGCWAIASVNAYAYDVVGNAGVSFGLNNIQKVKDGDPLGGRSRPEEDFAPVASSTNATSSATDMFS